MSLLLAALLLQPMAETTAPMGSITIPDELEPAMMPYFDCLRSGTGKRITLPLSDPAVMDSARDMAVAECRDSRATAAGKADRTLRAQGIGAEARRQRIETLLSNIEGFFGGDLIRSMVARGRAAAAAKAKGQPNSGRTETPPSQD